jgi:hypothetical protein
MRYAILIFVLGLTACSPRFDAGRQCYQDAGGFGAAMTYGYHTYAEDFTRGTPEYQAYHQQLDSCMARYDAGVAIEK